MGGLLGLQQEMLCLEDPSGPSIAGQELRITLSPMNPVAYGIQAETKMGEQSTAPGLLALPTPCRRNHSRTVNVAESCCSRESG